LEKKLLTETKEYLSYFCEHLGDRYVGSQSNQEAAEYIKEIFKKNGCKITEQSFKCFDWQPQDLVFEVDNESYSGEISPYSASVEVESELITAESLKELKNIEGQGKVILIRGELTKEQLVPKNFPFYSVEEHKEIINLLETKGFKAVIAATGKDKNSAGGLYPFPLIEDGDFQIPSIFIKDVLGEKLKEKTGKKVYLKIDTKKTDSKGKNIIASLGNNKEKKIVLFAHIDSKINSPGAIDNASGIVALLLLAKLLTEKGVDKHVEIALLNGEDYYSNPGQRLYFIENSESLANIRLAINIDGMGYKKGSTAYSMYTTEQKLNDLADNIFKDQYQMVRGEPWYQGEHAILVQQGKPAVAFTSELLEEILEKVHTPQDNLSLIDHQKVVDTARALTDFIEQI